MIGAIGVTRRSGLIRYERKIDGASRTICPVLSGIRRYRLRDSSIPIIQICTAGGIIESLVIRIRRAVLPTLTAVTVIVACAEPLRRAIPPMIKTATAIAKRLVRLTQFAEDDFTDLDCIERGSFSQIIGDHPKVQTVIDGRIFSDAAHIDCITTRRALDH